MDMIKCLILDCHNLVSYTGKQRKSLCLCISCKMNKRHWRWKCKNCPTILVDEMVTKEYCEPCYKICASKRHMKLYWKTNKPHLNFRMTLLRKSMLELPIARRGPVRYSDFLRHAPRELNGTLGYNLNMLLRYGLMRRNGRGHYNITPIGRELIDDKSIYSNRMNTIQ